MDRFWLLVLILTFHEVLIALDALSCPKGKKLVRGSTRCETCPDGYYQPEENYSQMCQLCTTCAEDAGSFVKQECTKETDTICQCQEGFVPWASDSSLCKCGMGFELDLKQKKCSKCEEGYFSKEDNSRCQQWKDCKSAGVKTKGTGTSDVICKEELTSDSPITTPPASNKIVSHRSLTTHRPQEGTQTPKMHNTITTAASQQVTSKDKGQPYTPSNTGNYIGMALLIFGIAGLLALTVTTYKMHIALCWQKKTTVQTKDSFCRRPVEESGDDSQSSLKPNTEEP